MNTKGERWGFSESELTNPANCKSNDELIAYVYIDTEFDTAESYGIIVYRNGRITHRFDDGSTGVPKRLVHLVQECEILLHPNGETTQVWKNVEVDTEGNFIQFSGV